MTGDSPEGAAEITVVAILADRLRRLERLSRELAAATSLDDVVRVVMESLDAPSAGPTRGLWLHDPERDELELIAQHGMQTSAADTFNRIPTTADVPGATAFREGRTVISSSRADAVDRYPDLEDTDRSTEGFIAVPLCIEDECMGVLAFGYDEALVDTEVSFLETVASHVAQTLARVRLGEAVQQRAVEAAAAAERERRRREQLEFLSHLTDTALGAADHRQLMRGVASAAVPTLGDWCSLHFVPMDGGAVEMVVAHADPARIAWAEALSERYPYDADSGAGVAGVIRSGETTFIPEMNPEIVDEVVARSRIDPDEARRIIDSLDLTSVIIVPLLTKRRVAGAMQFVTAESRRRYDESDVALAEAVAGRVAEMVENRWLTEQHRHISVTLQRALLPPQLPRVPGLDVAARYWPAEAMSEVGGDFYDLFAIGERSWAVLIGDACGTGPNAAALTSIARHTVRAASRHRRSHIEVMDWLNQAIGLSDRDLFCTACYATVEDHGSSWSLHATSAGHPLPIVAKRGGATTTLGAPGTLLGVFDEIKVRTGTTSLEPGDVVLFYTDGVTDLPPPAGLTEHELAQFIHELPPTLNADGIAEAIRTSVAERVPDAQRRDDIALLVLRIGERDAEPPPIA